MLTLSCVAAHTFRVDDHTMNAQPSALVGARLPGAAARLVRGGFDQLGRASTSSFRRQTRDDADDEDDDVDEELILEIEPTGTAAVPVR